MKVLLLVACLIAAVLGSAAPPTLSETFTASISITIKDGRGDHYGKGVWAIDQPGNKGIESYVFDEGEFDVYNLQRYDLGEYYQVVATNKSRCVEMAVTGSMPALWTWLSQASFDGTVHGVDMWKADIGYATMVLGVMNDTVPVFLSRYSRGDRTTTYDFLTFNTSTPAASLFAVPSSCSNSSSHSRAKRCVSGGTMISRAKVWVDKKVPYNQGATYDGYREDCSGYVSMAWESSKPGHVTSTFHEISHQITKSELVPGDCLLYAAEHVVLFGGWTNKEQTEYQAYEETKPGEGTVTRPTPYPYWYSQSDFLPYRYNDMCK
jgi:hypothetical protein